MKLLAAAVPLIACSVCALGQYDIIILPRPVRADGTPAPHLLGSQISRDGRFLTGSGYDHPDDPSWWLGYQYDRASASMTSFQPADGSMRANRASPSGDAVTFSSLRSGQVRWWTREGGYQSIDLPGEGWSAELRAVADGGRTMLITGTDVMLHEGAWTSPALPPGASRFSAWSVSADGGTVAGNVRFEGQQTGFMLHRFEEGWTDLRPFLPAGTTGGGVELLSADGRAAVLRAVVDGAPKSFVWSEHAGIAEIPYPGMTPYSGYYFGTSDLSLLGDNTHIWTHETGLIDLAAAVNASGVLPPGAELLWITDAADDHRTFSVIVRTADGEHPAILTIPAPGPAAMVVAGSAAFVARRRRHARSPGR